MMLLTNEIDPDDVSYEQMNGREYLVAPVTPIKAMRLHKGYVPKAHVKKSAPAWNGTPATLNHPTNAEGKVISANSPDVVEKNWMGHLFDNKAIDDGERTQGQLWIDIENARNLGGEAEQAVNDLENGESISVSSSYFGDELPSGEYDGEYREEVMGNLRPDHLAILPNTEGRCSIDDGCMAGAPAANDIQVAALPDGGTDDPDESSEDPMGEATDTMQDEPDPETVGNRLLNAIGLAGNNEESGTGGDEGNGGEQTGNESPDSDTDKNNMGDRTQNLVENHDFDEENLPDEDTQCFNQIYEKFAGNEDNEEEEEEEPDTSEDDDPDSSNTITPDELESRLEEVKTEAREEAKRELKANQEEEEREELIDEIVENSDRERDELEDIESVTALEVIQDETSTPQQAANFAARPGASPDAGSEDDSSMPSLSANERLKEKESDD